MNHTYYDSQNHLHRESCYLSVREPSVDAQSLQPFRCPRRAEDTHSEERTQEQAYKECHSAEETDKSVHLAQTRILHLQFHDQCDKHKQNTVAGISHTHREEQHEERSENRCRVELVIYRHAVHSGQHFEIPRKPVVMQLDRRIVLLSRSLRRIIDSEVVERLAEFLVILSGSKAREYRNIAIHSLFRSHLSEIKIELT